MILIFHIFLNVNKLCLSHKKDVPETKSSRACSYQGWRHFWCRSMCCRWGWHSSRPHHQWWTLGHRERQGWRNRKRFHHLHDSRRSTCPILLEEQKRLPCHLRLWFSPSLPPHVHVFTYVSFSHMLCLRMYLWCSAFFHLSSLRKVSRKPENLNTVWCYCCFY